MNVVRRCAAVPPVSFARGSLFSHCSISKWTSIHRSLQRTTGFRFCLGFYLPPCLGLNFRFLPSPFRYFSRRRRQFHIHCVAVQIQNGFSYTLTIRGLQTMSAAGPSNSLTPVSCFYRRALIARGGVVVIPTFKLRDRFLFFPSPPSCNTGEALVPCPGDEVSAIFVGMCTHLTTALSYGAVRNAMWRGTAGLVKKPPPVFYMPTIRLYGGGLDCYLRHIGFPLRRIVSETIFQVKTIEFKANIYI